MSVRFSTLDRRRLRELKPGEKITEPGITVVRLADGDLRYSVAIMVDGERIYRVIGKASERVTRTQCEEFIAQKQTEARAGRLSLPKARKLALTVAAAARRYLQRLEESGGNNIPIKRRQLDIYLVPYFGAQRLDAITEFAVGKYKSSAWARARRTPRSIASSPRCLTCFTAPSIGNGSTGCRCGSANTSSRRATAGSSYYPTRRATG